MKLDRRNDTRTHLRIGIPVVPLDLSIFFEITDAKRLVRFTRTGTC